LPRPKFIADADLRQSIVLGVRLYEPAVDFLTAREGGTLGLSDPEVLALAAGTGRIVVSSDQKTMPGHFWTFVGSSESPGVIIVPQSVEMARAIRELISIWQESEGFPNRIRWVKKRN
jgi:hypothetical protein